MPLLKIAEILFLLTIILFFLILSWYCRLFLGLPGFLGRIWGGIWDWAYHQSMHCFLLVAQMVTGQSNWSCVPKLNETITFFRQKEKLWHRSLLLVVGFVWVLLLSWEERYSLFWLQLGWGSEPYTPGALCPWALEPSASHWGARSHKPLPAWAMGFSRPHFSG